MTSHASFSFSAALYSFFFPFMASAALSWPLTLLSVSLLLSTVSSFLSWPLLHSHGLSCFFEFLCCSLQFLLSFHGLCCSLIDSHAPFSYSAVLYSFFFPFTASSAVSQPLLLFCCFNALFHGLCGSFHDLSCLSWPLLLSQQSLLLFHSLRYFLLFFLLLSRPFAALYVFANKKFWTHFSLSFRYFNHTKLERRHGHSYLKSRI